jgi:hypothetical protein
VPNSVNSNSNAVAAAVSTTQRRALLVVGGGVLLGGCATGAKTGGRIQDLTEAPMEDAPSMPSKQQIERATTNTRSRVVILQPQEAEASRGAGLPAVAIAALEQLLGQGVEIVDRNLAGRLDAELKRAEMAGSGGTSYTGGDVADFAISLVMGVAGWSFTDNPASQSIDKKTGKMVTTPRNFTHNARSAMTIRVFEMPSLRLISSIPADSSVTLLGQAAPMGPSQGFEQMRRATQNAIAEKRGEVLNDFSPRGYVSERRVKGDLSYFRTTLGRRTGATVEQEIEIIRLQNSVDPLTKVRTVNEAVIAKGVVTDDLSDNHSYVAVKDVKEATRVRRGDVVRTKFNLSTTEKGVGILRKVGLPF